MLLPPPPPPLPPPPEPPECKLPRCWLLLCRLLLPWKLFSKLLTLPSADSPAASSGAGRSDYLAENAKPAGGSYTAAEGDTISTVRTEQNTCLGCTAAGLVMMLEIERQFGTGYSQSSCQPDKE